MRRLSRRIGDASNQTVPAGDALAMWITVINLDGCRLGADVLERPAAPARCVP
jgi:hypothetical protein